jgi:hypothetical protein
VAIQSLANAGTMGEVELAELVSVAGPPPGPNNTEKNPIVTLHEIDPGPDNVASNPTLSLPCAGAELGGKDTLQGKIASSTVLPTALPGSTTPGPYTMVRPPGADPLHA